MGDDCSTYGDHGTSNTCNHSNQTFESNRSVKDGVTECTKVFDDLEGPLIIWNTTLAFVSSMALKAALLLNIPDILANAGPEGTLSLVEIAAKLSGKAPQTHYLRRLLRFLAVKKIVRETAVDTLTGATEWRYGLTNASWWLVKANKLSLAPMTLMQLDKVTQAAWHCIDECLLEGGPDAFERANGKDIWSFAKEFPDFNNLFNEAMVAGSKIFLTSVLRYYEGLKDVKSLVDVGGGLGLTSSMIVSEYPHIKCINFDLPHVIATTSPIPGVEHVSGDMFESVPSADAIIMKWIMHDWDDEQCIKILRNCYNALPEKGKVIIIDIVLDLSREIQPYIADLKFSLDLVMIAHTSGGKERTREEWHDLLNRAGFPDYRIYNIPNLQSVIEAYKT